MYTPAVNHRLVEQVNHLGSARQYIRGVLSMQVLGPPAVPGTALQARILDVSKDTGIVDVSVKPSLVNVAVNATPSSKGQNTEEEEEDRDKAAKKMKKGSKKRKAEEALDAAHAADMMPKVAVASHLEAQ